MTSTPSHGNANPSLIVFADDWGRHPSSCQHLVRRLTDKWRILWVNSIGTRQVKANGFTVRRGVEKLRSWSRGVHQVSDQMWVLDPPMLPMIANPISRYVSRQLVTVKVRQALRRLGMSQPLVLTTLPYTIWLLGDVGQRGLIYYCTDNYSFWPSADGKTLQIAEREIGQQAGLILAASQRLRELHSSAARCEYFPHAVDYEHFAASANGHALPEQLATIPGPRIGYFGLIYEQLDYELLTKISRELPTANLVLLGPVDYCPSEFANLPNVHLLGKKPYGELPRWIAGMDVLLLPYVNDEMIRQSNPLKALECLASGKPTVGVDVPELRRLQPHLYVARDHADFVQAVSQAIAVQESPDVGTDRRRAIQNENWDSRALELHSHLVGLACG